MTIIKCFLPLKLRYDVCSTEFTSLKGTVQWVWVCSQSCEPSPPFNSRASHHSMSTVSHPSSLLPRPWQPRIYLLSLWICPFWTFCKVQSVTHAAFCVLLLTIKVSEDNLASVLVRTPLVTSGRDHNSNSFS